MDLEQKIYSGARAKELLESDEFKGAFDQVETEILSQWKHSPARDQEGREKLWLMLSLLTKVKATLTKTMETGKLAGLELEHRKSLWQRAKSGWSSSNE